jgi:hypothetical protein
MATCTGTPTDTTRNCNGALNEEELISGEPCPFGCTYVEPFTNLFPQLNLSRNCMVLIIILLVFILFKDEIMKLSIVKSISKSLK